MKVIHSTIFLKSRLFIILFLYVFAFYFKGVSVSILLGIGLWLYSAAVSPFWRQCMKVLNSLYIKRIICIWVLLSCISILYPLVCLTFDFSFAKLVLTQAIHLLSAVPVFAWLLSNRVSHDEVESVFIWIFVLQTLVQIIVYLSPTLGEAILKYNHYDPDTVIGIGSAVRGKALSAATTYHLTMAYGIAFILYLKHYYYNHISLFIVIVGLLLFIGIFFAGRTGFVGCAIGIVGYILDKKISLTLKLKNALKALINAFIIVFVSLTLLITLCPDIWDRINTQVLPYAFEFLYSQDAYGQMETASTNRLKEMWDSDFSFINLLVGTGHYTNPDGSFYMHVDPGILRHMLFMGVFGYVILVYYQWVLFPINKFRENRTKYYSVLILVFLIVMEFKCINLGVNKFAFSITLLFSFSYLYLPQVASKYKKT